MSFRRSVPWTQQPQIAVGVNWANPISNGLLMCVVGSNPSRNLAGQGSIVFTGGILTGVGVAGQFADNTLGRYFDYTPPSTLTAATILSVEGRYTGMTEISPWRTNESENDYSPYSDGNYYFNTWGTSRYITAAAAPSGTNSAAYVVAARGSAGAQSVFVNGQQIGSAAQTFTANASIRFGYGINTSNPATGSNSFLRVLWGRSISDAEMASISTNPWQLFAPLSRHLAFSNPIQYPIFYLQA
jgi:hypothetical protein